jgi:hypothetical protein
MAKAGALLSLMKIEAVEMATIPIVQLRHGRRFPSSSNYLHDGSWRKKRTTGPPLFNGRTIDPDGGVLNGSFPTP